MRASKPAAAGVCAAVLLGNVINGASAGYSNRDRLEKLKSNSRLFKSLTQTIQGAQRLRPPHGLLPVLGVRVVVTRRIGVAEPGAEPVVPRPQRYVADAG